MKYSLILPVYNVAEYLERCLTSILKTSFEDYEIILVNDGSLDNSSTICDTYARTYHQVTCYHIPNQGVAHARLFGLERAQGEYIWFIDPDDYILGDPLTQLVPSLDLLPDVLMFDYQDYHFQKKIVEKVTSPYYGYLNQETFRKQFVSLFGSNMLYTVWNKLYRRDFLLTHQLSFPKLTFGEDTRFNFEVYRQLNSMVIVDGNYYTYVIGRPSSAANVYRPERLQAKLEEHTQLLTLLDEFGQESATLSRYLRSKIVMNVANNISQSNLSYKSKKQELAKLLALPEFKGIFTNNSTLTKPVKLTLGLGFLDAYLLLKKIKV
ncbi:glycosyltransferase family 2 protein [Streptococcus sp. sy004]|uniref:glycosyltransferase family 2 protein n=1 Tax=Streptococcus sp. sy004 TaxID=2600149 RepID=UPI0011B541DF|nr:glycosyltransferase family 2 protein [Streptococcus sp. sy004]TWT11024.1 glycosyltransferase family 2 protein [Streptococcus sp. sy004]